MRLFVSSSVCLSARLPACSFVRSFVRSLVCLYTEYNFLAWKANSSGCWSHHIVYFLGSRRMETAPTSIEVLLRPTLGQLDEPCDLRGSLSPTTSLHTGPGVYSTWCVPGGHPSNYGPGPALLSFSDRTDTDELTPYWVWTVPSTVYAQPRWQISGPTEIQTWYLQSRPVCSEQASYMFARWHIYHARKIMVSVHI